MVRKVRHVIDKGLDKMVSRKLLAWATATGLLAFSDLASGDWVIITCVYIGGQTVVDTVARLKGVDGGSSSA
jgi:hypothetical protein